MQISVARPGELGPGETALWRSMQRQTRSLANPFLSPEFAIAVDNFRSSARVAVLADGPEIVGFFPFERRRFGVGVPIGAGLNDCQGLIHAPAVEWDPQELLRACKLAVWQFGSLVEGQCGFERYTVTVASAPVIDLTDGFTGYREKLAVRSPDFCRDIARKTRKLERDAGELHSVVDSRDIKGLRELLRWKSDQYHRNGWINVFDRPWIVDLVDYFFSTHTDSFGGLLSILFAGETPVAAHFGLRSDHVLAHWFPAYDIRFRKCSPGLIQFMHMAEELAAVGVDGIDLGQGTGYKETLKSHDVVTAEGMVTQGLTASVHQARRVFRSWAGRQVKQHPPLLHAADRLSRHYGRIGGV